MTYTPINWQNGDTITAEKLNKMDNGWEVQETQLFSETVTTVAGQMGNTATLTYASSISASTIIATFDENVYTCDVVDFGDGMFAYGGIGEMGPDFTDYPFAIVSMNGANTLYTETAGNHTVSAAATDAETTAKFRKAVNSCVEIPSANTILCVSGVTTRSDAEGKLPFFYEPGSTTSLHIITTIGAPCTVIPETSAYSASFSRDDGIFRITTL